MEANCTANDDVFDACLRVDGDSDPTAAPTGRSNCNPQPATRQRRLVI
jgi:hypothetical protein